MSKGESSREKCTRGNPGTIDRESEGPLGLERKVALSDRQVVVVVRFVALRVSFRQGSIDVRGETRCACESRPR